MTTVYLGARMERQYEYALDAEWAGQATVTCHLCIWRSMIGAATNWHVMSCQPRDSGTRQAAQSLSLQFMKYSLDD